MSSTNSNSRRRSFSSRTHQRTRPPNPLSSSSYRKLSASRRLKTPKSNRVDVLQRSRSEPNLWNIGLFFGDDEEKEELRLGGGGGGGGGLVHGPQAQSCVDIFVLPSMSPLASKSERYNKDAKVVVNVTVEGSPGPVRTLVKLGANVEDTIKLIVDKYSQEGRSPQIGHDGVSSFELHHSHFSLQSIDKKDKIGDVGARSFYLRKSSSGRGSTTKDGQSQLVFLPSATAIVPVKPADTPFVFLPAFINRKMSKIGRRLRNLWKVLSCST